MSNTAFVKEFEFSPDQASYIMSVHKMCLEAEYSGVRLHETPRGLAATRVLLEGKPRICGVTRNNTAVRFVGYEETLNYAVALIQATARQFNIPRVFTIEHGGGAVVFNQYEISHIDVAAIAKSAADTMMSKYAIRWFKVEVSEIHIQPYYVLAACAEEANDIVADGEGVCGEDEMEYSHSLPISSNVTTEVKEDNLPKWLRVADEDQRAAPGERCPKCGERRRQNLWWTDESTTELNCASCGNVYKV